MDNITTFSQLYQMAQTQIEVFDLGRQFQQLNSDDFYKIETGEIAYPFPYKNSAHIAILTFHPDHPEKHSMWLFKWGLDEQNVVNIAQQQTCLERVVTSLMTKDDEERRRLLQDHPFHFKPNDIVQACFHAKASMILEQPVSQYFEATSQYFLTDQNQDWQSIGVQGVAELVWRLTDDDKKVITQNFNQYAKPAQLCFLACLEHVNDDPSFSVQLIKAITLDEFELFSHVIRAVSKTADDQDVKNWIHELINHHQDLHLECLLAMATRAFLALDDDIVMINLFHKLAQASNVDTIDVIAKDLATMETLRPLVVRALRVPMQ